MKVLVLTGSPHCMGVQEADHEVVRFDTAKFGEGSKSGSLG